MNNNIDQAPGVVDERPDDSPWEVPVFKSGGFVVTLPEGFNPNRDVVRIDEVWSGFGNNVQRFIEAYVTGVSDIVRPIADLVGKLKEWNEEANGTTTQPRTVVSHGVVLPERKFNHGPRYDPHAKRGMRK